MRVNDGPSLGGAGKDNHTATREMWESTGDATKLVAERVLGNDSPTFLEYPTAADGRLFLSTNVFWDIFVFVGGCFGEFLYGFICSTHRIRHASWAKIMS